MAHCGGGNNDKSNGGGDHCDSHKSKNKCGGGKNKNNCDGVGDNMTEDLLPHPVKEQLPGIQYCVNSPPPWGSYFSINFLVFLIP